MTDQTWIRAFSEISATDVPLVGGKNASLGEMYRELAARGVRVPDGFAITAEAYRHVLEAAGIEADLHRLLDDLDAGDVADLTPRAARRRARSSTAPGCRPTSRSEIRAAYRRLQDRVRRRRSASPCAARPRPRTCPTASFAGQHETFLNVPGEARAARRGAGAASPACSPTAAIHYRIDHGFDHFKVALSVGVMKMVRSDLAVVRRDVHPRHRVRLPRRRLHHRLPTASARTSSRARSTRTSSTSTSRPTRPGHRAVLRRRLGDKAVTMVYVAGGSRDTTRNIPTPEGGPASASASTTTTCSSWPGTRSRSSDHYGRARWTSSGPRTGSTAALYIVQARPETVASQRSVDQLETLRPRGARRGARRGPRGRRPDRHRARRAWSRHPVSSREFRPGEVLVADTTTPDWEPVMKTAAGVVTNRGGRTCHAAIVARELGHPGRGRDRRRHRDDPHRRRR